MPKPTFQHPLFDAVHFTAWFKSKAKPLKRPVPSEPIEPIDVRGLPVLVVDDNSTNRRILQQMLINWHMKPTVVDSGKAAIEALERAERRDEPFVLMLLDAVMPEIDGFAVAEELRRHGKVAGPIIMMLTSAGRRGDAAKCRQLGLAAYLTKPISQTGLFDAIMTALAMKDQDKESPRLITRHSMRESHLPSYAPERVGGLRILVAEDNVVNQKLIVRMIEKRGHGVVVASNGREAVERFKAGHYDVILMDVQMPEMDGIAATREIRNSKLETRNLPIIALTAHAMKGDREKCLEAGMDEYVTKPIKAEELFSAIEKLAFRES